MNALTKSLLDVAADRFPVGSNPYCRIIALASAVETRDGVRMIRRWIAAGYGNQVDENHLETLRADWQDDLRTAARRRYAEELGL